MASRAKRATARLLQQAITMSLPAATFASAGQNHVFFCPGVDLAAMRAGEFGCLDFGRGPELFFDGLSGRGEFRSGRTPYEQPFDDWAVS